MRRRRSTHATATTVQRRMHLGMPPTIQVWISGLNVSYIIYIVNVWMTTGQPLAWTENEGWFEEWNSASDQGWDDRTPEDMANVIAKVFWLSTLCF